MTINNLFINLSEEVYQKLSFIGTGKTAAGEAENPHRADDFNDANSAERLALLQLEFVADKIEAI
jgi:hypothetical protein